MSSAALVVGLDTLDWEDVITVVSACVLMLCTCHQPLMDLQHTVFVAVAIVVMSYGHSTVSTLLVVITAVLTEYRESSYFLR